MKPHQTVLSLALTSLFATASAHADMTLTSSDINAGEKMPKAQEFAGFGCSGSNLSPQLSWANAPANTKSFAITAYDPDAPTGSGWWHWVVANIPASVSSLESGAGSDNSTMPAGSQTFRTDYGSKGFGGACPPEGDKAHRYQFKVFALDVDTLELPADGSAALVGYYLNAHALETATLEALYQR
ncbi:YbhB/YbcL family Raf kinase inhibitor-like protein [Litoribrevibacter albus]|uniref:Kinase inhibitor n=1 Tax=Litoribrevibacter albus TaxID=1473156 RepID=A0AA37SFF8_9GAMM|nr:YbhB/YbcL family Raf kinase inhibitor-like protein [Litoribrevibacter albus]GLQ33557.1 kinase inhibitor [Litoribrevibacter albus]